MWPDGLEGPFELAEVIYVRRPVPAHHHDPDGPTIELEGWIGLPDLPDGVRAPVALTSSPYLGSSHVNLTCPPDTERADAPGCDITPGQDQFWTDTPGPGPIRNWGVNPIELVRAGFAAAFFSQRGTGNSGGCWSLFGPGEQADPASIVDWLAGQPWSNGRVAMGGLSFRSVPPVAAAVDRAEALKTIVITGTVLDFYTAVFSPQGALRFWDGFFVDTLIPSAVSALPPSAGGAQHATLDHLPVLPERACPEVVEALGAGERDWLNEHRNEAFWTTRSFLERLPDVTSSILLAQGFQDSITHGFQDSPLWTLTPKAPKRQITGQWGHEYPWPSAAGCADDNESDQCSWFADAGWDDHDDDWNEILLSWLDYWLKGQGSAPRLGTADYQDTDHNWHASDHWPPAESSQEVLYLSGSRLLARPEANRGDGDRHFSSAPTLLNADRRTWEYPYTAPAPTHPWSALCPDPATAEAGTAGLVYVSETVATETLLAGEPFVHLELSSDQPGGTVRVQLLEVEGDTVDCDGTGEPTNVKTLTTGAADLRFHSGGFTAKDYPPDESQHVRVDLWDLAETVQGGNSLAVVIMAAEPTDTWSGQPLQPRLTIHAGGIHASQIVLPVVSGTTGGEEPQLLYPRRPFVPELAPPEES